MSQSRISIIVAMDEKRGIGKDGKIPWHIAEDLKRFKSLTTSHPVIMGRKTFESIGRPLPNRTNIVVTHIASFARPRLAKLNVEIVHSLEAAIKLAQKSEGSNEVFIIGGGQIYAQAIDLADKLYLTIVEGDYSADTFFPEYEDKGFRVVNEEKGQEGEYKFSFVNLER